VASIVDDFDEPTSGVIAGIFRLHHGLSLQSENAGFSRKAANWIQDDKGMLSCLERNQG
jgi:hypothetical protein